MDRNLWRKNYGSMPPLPCPRCTSGKLKNLANSFQRHVPQHFKFDLSQSDVPDVTEGRFTQFMFCDFGFCGEMVAVSGDFRSHETNSYDDSVQDYVMHESRELTVRAMVPAPPLIAMPDKLGASPRAHLRQAFELFWMNRGACANRLRIVIETTLDQFEIPRKGKRRNGRKGDLDLSERIDLLEAAKPGHKDALDALRHVGNFGSHDGEADFDDLLDCFDLLEDTLIELIEERRAKRLAKAKAIISRKGRPLKSD